MDQSSRCTQVRALIVEVKPYSYLNLHESQLVATELEFDFMEEPSSCTISWWTYGRRVTYGLKGLGHASAHWALKPLVGRLPRRPVTPGTLYHLEILNEKYIILLCLT